jgi:ribose 5-phosphate isomerase A
MAAGLSVDRAAVGSELDYYIDGADEITRQGVALKGLGGAITREKLLRLMADTFIVLVDPTKLVYYLGKSAPVSIEIVPFACDSTLARIRGSGLSIREMRVRKDGKDDFVTDNGNLIVDAFLREPLKLPAGQLRGLELSLKTIPGVLESGIFSTPADLIIVGGNTELETETISPNTREY